MLSARAVVRGAGWAGVARGPSGERDLTRAEAVPLAADPKSLARLFPGRWNPRRALPEGLEPLVSAFAMALGEAGWWTPEMAAPVEGALVLGTDSHSLEAAVGFAREMIQRGPGGLSPTRFLFSLPSSATAVLGILFGLREYQATVTEGGLSGVRALAHALDLLRTGRIARAAVGAVTVLRGGLATRLAQGGEADSGSEEIELAVALCLAAEPGGDGVGEAVSEAGLPRIEECCILDSAPEEARPAEAAGIDPAHRHLAAPALLSVAVALVEGGEGPRLLLHREPGRPGVGLVRIRPGRCRGLVDEES